jgi:flagellar protein FlgJ
MAFETGSIAQAPRAVSLKAGTPAVGTSVAGSSATQSGFSRYMESSLEKVRSSLERDRAKVPVDGEEEQKLYDRCLELETFLVKNILNGMRKNVMKSSLVDSGYAGEIYEDMLWDKYAGEYTKSAGFGLAELAYLELTGRRGKVRPGG